MNSEFHNIKPYSLIMNVDPNHTPIVLGLIEIIVNQQHMYLEYIFTALNIQYLQKK